VGILASSFARSEPMLGLCVGHVNNKVCHNSPCTEGGLKEIIQNVGLQFY
jgi:hypothetical protein